MVAAVVFAMTNRAPVVLDLWPFNITVEAPLFVIVLASAFVGLLAGAVAGWLSGAATRRRARAAERRVHELERELTRLRHAAQRSNDRPGEPASSPAPKPVRLPRTGS